MITYVNKETGDTYHKVGLADITLDLTEKTRVYLEKGVVLLRKVSDENLYLLTMEELENKFIPYGKQIETEHVSVGEVYFYKHNYYRVISFAKAKPPASSLWVESVVYENNKGEVFVRSLIDFKAKFRWEKYWQW